MSFAAPLFLLAVLAGVIPILLHLLHRQQAPVLPFSTLRFLKVSVQKTRQRKRLQDLLLLALRVAALALLAVALARPTVTHLANWLGRRANTAAVIVLDNSASMATVDQTGPRWERAVRAAEQLCDELGAGDSLALLTTCGPERPESRRLLESHDAARQALAACQVGYEQADLAAQLAQARRLLSGSALPRKEIYVITDMQAASWSGFGGAGPAEPPASAGQPPAPGGDQATPLLVVDVHGPGKPNVALRSVTLTAAAPAAGVPLRVEVEAVGDVASPRKAHLALYVNGQREAASPTLELPAGGAARHVFQFTAPAASLVRGEARLVEADANALDDRLYFALRLDPRVRVALMRPQAHDIEYLDEIYYLRRAFPAGEEEGFPVRSDVVTPAVLRADTLAPYAAVFCVNLPALGALEAKELHDYVAAGGHVIWICGENVDPALYNRMNDLAPGKLLPLPLESLRTVDAERPDGWRLSWLDAAYPPLTPLAEPASLAQAVLAQKCFALAEPPGHDARVLARWEDGRPALARRKLGAGSVALWTSSAHVDWTNFPLQALFLPLWTRLTLDLADAQAIQPQGRVGRPFETPLAVAGAGGLGGATLEIARPGGAVERRNVTPAERVFRYADTFDAGVYELRLLNAARPWQRAYALNLEPRETEARILGEDELRALLAKSPHDPKTVAVCREPEAVTAALRALREGASLWDFFLLVVLGVLVAEAFVANRLVKQPPPPISPP